MVSIDVSKLTKNIEKYKYFIGFYAKKKIIIMKFLNYWWLIIHTCLCTFGRLIGNYYERCKQHVVQETRSYICSSDVNDEDDIQQLLTQINATGQTTNTQRAQTKRNSSWLPVKNLNVRKCKLIPHITFYGTCS